jgi:predicted phosphodiesterase
MHPPANLAFFGQALQRLPPTRLDALCLLGDLTQLGDVASFRAVFDVARTLGLPIRFVLGNHDVAGDIGECRPAAAESISSIERADERGESVTASLRLAGLNIQRTGGTGSFRFASVPDVSAWGDSSVITLAHFPVLSRRRAFEQACRKYAGDVVNADQTEATLLSRSAPTVVLHGHLHMRDAVPRGRVLQLGFGALAEVGHEFATLTLTTEPNARRLRVDVETHLLDASQGSPGLTPLRTTWQFSHGRWAAAAERQISVTP